MTEPIAISLSPRTVLRLSGPDAERYLNGQVTNDVTDLSPEKALYCAVLNAKGQLDAVCHVRKVHGDYLIDAPFELREDLLARLDRYIIADDVELTDESERWHLMHLVSPTSPASEIEPVAVDRFGAPGFDLLTSDSGKLPAPSPGAAEQSERLRIENGVPAWGAELVPGLLPAEAGLDRTAVSFDKGCYLGQEVVSRMKRAGKTNRHLVQLELSGPVSCPAPLFAGETEAGTVTSITTGDGRVLALGYRARKFADCEQFAVGDSGVTARVERRLGQTQN